jgi:hypothetical protein
MNTPIDPPANEPKLPEAKPIIPVEAKIEEVSAAAAVPISAADSESEAHAALESKPVEKPDDTKKQGSVYTKGLVVCGNCGTELLGETCYQCGQPTKGLVRQFSSIVGDFLDTVLNVDTRVFRTLGPLIFKPGFLTQEYFSGRRIRYVSPVRLFFFLAVLTFLLAQFSLPEDMASGENGNGVVQVNTAGKDEISKAKTIDEVEKFRAKALAELKDAKKEAAAVPMVGFALDAAREEINKKADKRIEQLKDQNAVGITENSTTLKNDKAPDDDEGGNISFNGEAWDAKKNPIKIGWVPDSINQWFNSLAKRATTNGKRVSKDPKVIIEAVLSSLPMTLFIMLPIFALLLKALFIFKRRLYMEHLIVALHSHAFLMIAIFILILFNDLGTWFSATAWVAVPVGILTALLWIWMPIYLFLMQKRVYQQGWILTFIKYVVIGNLHIILLSIAIACTLVVKMIWL